MNDFILREIQTTTDRLNQLSKTKGNEYSNGGGEFHNFTTAAENFKVQPIVVMGIFMSKHWSSIMKFINEQSKYPIYNAEINKNMSEPIEGRVDDLILYLIIMKAWVKYSNESRHCARAQSLREDVAPKSDKDADVWMGGLIGELKRYMSGSGV